MKVRMIAKDGRMSLLLQDKDFVVIDGENFGDVQKLCAFLFSSKMNMDEETAKDKLFMFVLCEKVAYIFVLSKSIYKSCLELIRTELSKSDCTLYYEDSIVFRYTNIV
jgi:hypothetical protein